MSRRGALAALLAAGALAALPAAASAHVLVRPSAAAPLDPVLWTVLVPNEREEKTVEIELQVPEGVIPFSFNDVPGWERTLQLNPDQSIGSIVW
jgi:uncharacterized protein YcnI